MTSKEWWTLCKQSADAIHATIVAVFDAEVAAEFDVAREAKDPSMLDLLQTVREAVIECDEDPPAGFGDLCLLCDAEVVP